MNNKEDLLTYLQTLTLKNAQHLHKTGQTELLKEIKDEMSYYTQTEKIQWQLPQLQFIFFNPSFDYGNYNIDSDMMRLFGITTEFNTEAPF